MSSIKTRWRNEDSRIVELLSAHVLTFRSISGPTGDRPSPVVGGGCTLIPWNVLPILFLSSEEQRELRRWGQTRWHVFLWPTCTDTLHQHQMPCLFYSFINIFRATLCGMCFKTSSECFWSPFSSLKAGVKTLPWEIILLVIFFFFSPVLFVFYFYISSSFCFFLFEQKLNWIRGGFAE